MDGISGNFFSAIQANQQRIKSPGTEKREGNFFVSFSDKRQLVYIYVYVDVYLAQLSGENDKTPENERKSMALTRNKLSLLFINFKQGIMEWPLETVRYGQLGNKRSSIRHSPINPFSI